MFRGLDLFRFRRNCRRRPPKPRVERFRRLKFRKFNCFTSSGSGEEVALLEVDDVVSGITRLRKSEIAFFCVYV